MGRCAAFWSALSRLICFSIDSGAKGNMGNTSSDSKPSSQSDAKELNAPSEQKVITMKDYILQKAKPFTNDWPMYNDPTIWGVLTAITESAINGRKYQGCQVFIEASVLL
ncbi:hypothetical protein HS088_TW11G00268 [Tripterygium wilfordii]|uniref:Uncharacterized protein n=1 Tax=Tripterygium wilfordii TaxID=458696 RepID=A0A7J7D1G9_TRIWF|nr:hypothetical protein HS088_TW11G00268 [Tripterygium wilfordii]